MKKSEIIKKINKMNFESKESILMASNNYENDIKIYEKIKKIKEKKFKNDDNKKMTLLIENFKLSIFTKYIFDNFNGHGIIEFAKNNNISLKTNGIFYDAKEINKLIKARNLFLVSKILEKNITKTLLRKIYNNFIKDADEIVELAKNIELKYE